MMALPYSARLLCLVLACFFLVYSGTALLTALYTPRAVRRARGLDPGTAARFLLTVRLLPAWLAIIGAFGFCLPSYLWFEPEGIEEQVGFTCLSLAILGCAIGGTALLRGIRAAFRSRQFALRCGRSGREMNLSCERAPSLLSRAVIIDSPSPFLALTGLVRPRVVISATLVEALPADELAVVLNHETAHRTSRDNLKRLALSLAPGFWPFLKSNGQLEQAWTRYAEYAADRQAVDGDARQSVALASALVRVARFGCIPQVACPLAISFLGDACDLSDRVDRLLTPAQAIALRQPLSLAIRVVFLVSGLGIAVITLNTTTFRFVQSLMERLIN